MRGHSEYSGQFASGTPKGDLYLRAVHSARRHNEECQLLAGNADGPVKRFKSHVQVRCALSPMF